MLILDYAKTHHYIRRVFMINLKLKETKTLSQIIPDIIELFGKNPDKEVVRITNSDGQHFEISRFDLEVYESLSHPKVQEYYGTILIQKQFCMKCNNATVLAQLLETIYNLIGTDAKNDYLAHLMSK